MKQKTSRMYNTFINTISGIFNQIIMIVLGFILRSTFIHSIGIEYVGVSSVFTSILTVLSLSELGFGTAISTSLYKPIKNNDINHIQKLMYFFKYVYRYVAIFIFCIGILLVPLLDIFITDVPNIKEDIRIIFVFFLIKTASSYLMIYKSTLLKASQKMYLIQRIEIICSITRYSLEIICLFVYKQYFLYLIIEVLGTILQNFVVTKYAEFKYKDEFKEPNEKLGKDEKKKIFKDVKALSIYKMSGAVNNSIDSLLISSMISTTTVGLLSNYTMIKTNVEALLRQLFSAVVPSIGDLASEADDNKQLLVFNRLYYISFILVNFSAVSLYVLFNPFLELWLGSEYLLDKKISFIIAFDFFLYIALQAFAAFRNANGMFVKGQFRPLITALLNVLLSFLFIKQYGIFGTILATVLCRLLTQWYDPYLLFKYVFKAKFSTFYIKYLSYICIFIMNAFVSDVLSTSLETNSGIINIGIRLLICCIIPNCTVILLTFHTQEFKYLKLFLSNYIKKKS